MNIQKTIITFNREIQIYSIKNINDNKVYTVNDVIEYKSNDTLEFYVFIPIDIINGLNYTPNMSLFVEQIERINNSSGILLHEARYNLGSLYNDINTKVKVSIYEKSGYTTNSLYVRIDDQYQTFRVYDDIKLKKIM
ncbi:MAG: hypothetical protein QXO37_02510 [Candidatus Nitrosocaldaceae archaeon]